MGLKRKEVQEQLKNYDTFIKSEAIRQYWLSDTVVGFATGFTMAVEAVEVAGAINAVRAVRPKNTQVSNQSTGNSIKSGSLNSLPNNAQTMYNKYDANGWKGSVSGQTPGTAAGSKYSNRDEKLPTADSSGNSITYKEFDVNNKLPNQNRDAQRFVRGSDGSVYYTDDHYVTFTKIK